MIFSSHHVGHVNRRQLGTPPWSPVVCLNSSIYVGAILNQKENFHFHFWLFVMNFEVVANPARFTTREGGGGGGGGGGGRG